MKKRLIALATIVGLLALSPLLFPLLAVLIAERERIPDYEDSTRKTIRTKGGRESHSGSHRPD